MKLEKSTNRSKRARTAEVLQTEQPVKSEIFDPRVDLPEGDLNRIKERANRHPGTAERARALVETAWIGWFDSEYKQAVQGNLEARNSDLEEFIDWRNGGPLSFVQISDNPSEVAQRNLEEKIAAYKDFSDLVEVFPEVRVKLQEPEFAGDFQEVLQWSIHASVEGSNISVVNCIQYLRIMIQAWPERRAEVVQALVEGGQAKQEWFVEQIEAERSISLAMLAAASLVVVFPELKKLVEGVVIKRMKEIQAHLRRMHAQLGEGDDSFYYYSRFIKCLTILGAESAGLDAQGDLRVQLRPLALRGTPQSLPVRPHV